MLLYEGACPRLCLWSFSGASPFAQGVMRYATGCRICCCTRGLAPDCVCGLSQGQAPSHRMLCVTQTGCRICCCMRGPPTVSVVFLRGKPLRTGCCALRNRVPDLLLYEGACPR